MDKAIGKLRKTIINRNVTELMRWTSCLVIIGIVFSFTGCEKVRHDAAALLVDFSWEGIKQCERGNPEIRFSGVPERTKFLVINMFDHAYSHDHGTVRLAYAGDRIIARDRFKETQGPCPAWTPGRYEITIKAVDNKNVVIGIGNRERKFPEDK